MIAKYVEFSRLLIVCFFPAADLETVGRGTSGRRYLHCVPQEGSLPQANS